LPMSVFETGIPVAAKLLGSNEGQFDAAARAILTTDTRPKSSSWQLGKSAVAGVAKGAAMIGPNMATNVGFLLADAAGRPADLQTILREAVEGTFNCISVEGHTSTNDTVLLLANGSGPPVAGSELAKFAAAVREVCADLARGIAADAEGA